MSLTTEQKLTALRALMTKSKADGLLIPTADAHLNEYVLASAKHREWLSSFDGSAGEALITHNQAFLFVDGRYHDQADQQIDLNYWTVIKLGKAGEPTVKTKIQQLSESKSGFKLAADPFTLTIGQWEVYESAVMRNSGAMLSTKQNWVSDVKKVLEPQATEALTNPITGLSNLTAGQSVGEKLTVVREKLKTSNADLCPITKLDEIAWLFNLRGQDIPYNPVFVSYAIVTTQDAFLFTDDSRFAESAHHTIGNNLTLKPYDSYLSTLNSLSKGKRILLDTKSNTQGTSQQLNQSNPQKIIKATNPIVLLKAIKNPAELKGMENAHLEASVALIKVWQWMENTLNSGQPVTEKAFSDQLEAFYGESSAFQGLSFNTIAGFGPNSAVIHYGTPSENIQLRPGGLFLFDSGSQYWQEEGNSHWMGTTDTTRTVAITEPGSPPTDQQRHWFTAVLKAHINCAMQRFPKETKGIQLDAITRANLWQDGLDFLHGTGHGVGAFLNVHEGPNGISNRNQTGLQSGMITSIEPGYYETGIGGIRLENLYQVVETQHIRQPIGDKLLGFESLIWVPFDPALIDSKQLEKRQANWLANYNQTVLAKLKPRLEAETYQWLKSKCQPLNKDV